MVLSIRAIVKVSKHLIFFSFDLYDKTKMLVKCHVSKYLKNHTKHEGGTWGDKFTQSVKKPWKYIVPLNFAKM